ncbi:2-oxoglutarate-dependent dioxygenase DAO-like [Coffea arabica]|uniref:2-oxoglutarate-dependent dioxygenase DAO n=1 Tax=Coffea arabica TaxID=13443 RepID=A0A6P6SE80_COFAR|nr:2-oxoglutarate-dependent dioxygenase DAO-like [Coffea arabica]XP_027063812.1 2-oxoglutarate-dependent dioxygenase DAO-like [Coffea arabica]
METKGVPLIDMQDPHGLPEKLVKACEEWGCFRVVNHGIPSTVLSEMKVVCRSLLDLPFKIKQGDSPPGPGQRYTPPNMASPYFEGLNIYDMASPGAVDDFCTQVHASPHQREIILKHSQALFELAKDLGGKMTEGLGLGGLEAFKDWPCQFQMNKYNYNPESVGSTGAVMHSDAGFITILQDDELVNGLEVVNKFTGDLVSVDPIPGTLVINIGDVGMVWSNGRFNNVKHRVQCYKATVRISIALFVFGPRGKRVEAPSELVDSEHPRLYNPFDFEAYRKLRHSTGSPTGEALELFRAALPIDS